jgi:hypothetical protein
MRTISILVLILLISCKGKYNREITSEEKLAILDRLKTKDCIYDTVKFNNFKEYYSLIPNLRLPFTFGLDRHPSYESDKIECNLFHSNYSYQSSSTIAKILRENYLAIIYGLPTSGENYVITTFTYDGTKIDEADIYELISLGPMQEDCKTKIDSQLNIHMIYNSVSFKSFDSNDTLNIENKEYQYQILENGKIKTIKKTTTPNKAYAQ